VPIAFANLSRDDLVRAVRTGARSCAPDAFGVGVVLFFTRVAFHLRRAPEPPRLLSEKASRGVHSRNP
jgi:hypothetical protein